jgi:4-carboxymuconolactone decarboxylase
VSALDPVSAAIVQLSAAIAAGDANGVRGYAEEALAAGADIEAVYETVLQSYLFVGFPRTIEAFFAAGPVLKRRGVGAAPDLEAWRRDGEALCHRVYGRNYEKLMETMQGLSPDLASWMILEGYGKTLSRPGLRVTDREYAVVAILTVTRMWRQLRSHAIGAIHVGGTREGVRGAIERSGRWAGESTVAEALSVVGMEGGDARR